MRARPRVSGVLAGVLAALAGITAGLLVIGVTGHLGAWPFSDGGSAAPSTSGSQSARIDDPVASPAPVVLPSSAAPTQPLPTTAGLTTTLAAALRAPALGSRVGMVVVDPDGRATLYSKSGTTLQAPASTAKLVTASSALHFLGPDGRLTTRTVAGATPGQVVLVGGGDPTLTVKASGPYPRTASLTDLARQTATAVKASGRSSVALVLDDSKFTGPRIGPGWMSADVTNGLVARVSALTLDEDRVTAGQNARYPDPTAATGRAFVKALKGQGITVTGTTRGVAATSATQLGAVQSPPISALVERMLLESDNDLAEALAHDAGVAAGTGGTFAGGTAAAQQTLTWMNIDPASVQLVDGSGISPRDRLEAAALGNVVSVAMDETHPELASVLSGMPVAGVSGSLADRFDTTRTEPARGLVRAKTGTLTGVNSLAGTALDRDGRTLVFVVLADQSSPDTLAVRAALDRVAAAVQSCGCR